MFLFLFLCSSCLALFPARGVWPLPTSHLSPLILHPLPPQNIPSWLHLQDFFSDPGNTAALAIPFHSRWRSFFFLSHITADTLPLPLTASPLHLRTVGPRGRPRFLSLHSLASLEPRGSTRLPVARTHVTNACAPFLDLNFSPLVLVVAVLLQRPSRGLW